MTKSNKNTEKFSELRKRAEAVIKTPNVATSAITLEETQRLIQELHTFQIELELQNEDLRNTQVELLKNQKKYTDLYDFAPTGYITISDKGLIKEVNLTASLKLGVSREFLLNQPFSNYIVPEDQDIYYRCRQRLLQTTMPQTCEYKLQKTDGFRFDAQCQCVVIPEVDGDMGQFRMMITDITDRKQAEQRIEENRRQLLDAFDQMSQLIQNVIVEKNINIRFENVHLVKCYEVKGCDQALCPCYGQEPMRCWQISGTFCDGEKQGDYVQKYKKCLKCQVFEVGTTFDPVSMIGEHFNNMMLILRQKHEELQKAFDEIKTLRGIVPICAYCKQIRDDKGYWSQVESYVTEHSEAIFSHGICPNCVKKIFSDYVDE